MASRKCLQCGAHVDSYAKFCTDCRAIVPVECDTSQLPEAAEFPESSAAIAPPVVPPDAGDASSLLPELSNLELLSLRCAAGTELVVEVESDGAPPERRVTATVPCNEQHKFILRRHHPHAIGWDRASRQSKITSMNAVDSTNGAGSASSSFSFAALRQEES